MSMKFLFLSKHRAGSSIRFTVSGTTPKLENGTTAISKAAGTAPKCLSIRYDPQIGEWNYRYFKSSRNSTKMFDLLSKLSAAIQTRQQFEEHGASPPDSPILDCEEEQDMEL